jgi:hypothetical protein
MVKLVTIIPCIRDALSSRESSGRQPSGFIPRYVSGSGQIESLVLCVCFTGFVSSGPSSVPSCSTLSGILIPTFKLQISALSPWAVYHLYGKEDIVQPFRPDDFHKTYKTRETGFYSSPEYESERRLDDPGVCVDKNTKCAEWAAAGECKKNAVYMTGEGSDAPGSCRLACKACVVCATGDVKCYQKNREAAGYLHLVDEVKALTGQDLPARF